jgi:phosphosulfolactate synthase (CoM biosynthesis protein A)
LAELENDNPFAFLQRRGRDSKPRESGLTEVRGPYYSVTGPRYVADLLDTMGSYIDGFKFGGGSFSLFPRSVLTDILHLCHENQVKVSTGAFIEYVLTLGPDAVNRYIDECASIGFDVLQISTGFVSVPLDDLLAITERATLAGLEVKPEIDVQFGAGAGSTVEELAVHGDRDVKWAVHQAKRHLEKGAHMIMVQSEGITESVNAWRLDVVSEIIGSLGMENLMFQAADPLVFTWYVKNYGPDINLFIDHSQIVQLECLRQGLWGSASMWGRVVGYDRPPAATA